MAGPKAIGDVLGQLMLRLRLADRTARGELEDAWREIAGELVVGRTRLGSLRRGVLEVLVDNATLLAELEGFRKQTLLKALTENCDITK